MPRLETRPYHNTMAVLTSMHAKERVIGPILRDELGLIVGLAIGVNTDQFGTFSREVERTGSQLDAARAKIAAGFEYAPLARVGIASEGSFGPHPHVPFMGIGRELVLMIDRESGLELTGYDASPETNFSHAVARDLDEALAFAERAMFPEHGLIVMGCKDEKPAPELLLNKEIADPAALEAAVRNAFRICGAAFVETDMRAHRNPTRMAAIEGATRDLARRFHSRCPNCDYPGFDVTERIPGLPCAWCGEPTRVIMAEVRTCQSCGHRDQRSVATAPTADPGQCDGCNP
jgi:hypothetical protein